MQLKNEYELKIEELNLIIEALEDKFQSQLEQESYRYEHLEQ